MDDRNSLYDLRYEHWIEDQVRFSDLDPLGHVNNNSVGQYFENARASFYEFLTPGWPQGQRVLVLARTAIDFHRELHMPAKLRIGTGVLSIGRTSMRLANTLFSDNHGIASCESISVLIDNVTRKPVELPLDLRDRASRYKL